MRRTWKIMKEITEKHKHSSIKFPNPINGKAVTKSFNIVEEFNKYFNNFGPSLADKFQSKSKLLGNFPLPQTER